MPGRVVLEVVINIVINFATKANLSEWGRRGLRRIKVMENKGNLFVVLTMVC